MILGSIVLGFDVTYHKEVDISNIDLYCNLALLCTPVFCVQYCSVNIQPLCMYVYFMTHYSH